MKRKCVNCGREFEVFNKSRKRNHGEIKRRSDCITCSHKCSNEYADKLRSER